MTIIAEYDAKKDDRGRLTLRQATAEHYHVVVFDDGHLELHPRVLADATISVRTLRDLDVAMANVREGRVGAPLDTAALGALVGDEPDDA